MDRLLKGRFESFVAWITSYPSCAKHAILLLECAPHSVSHAQLVELFSSCFQSGTRLLLPVQHIRLIPLICAAYDISIAPLRTLVRSSDADTMPLSYSLTATSSDSPCSLRALDAATVHLVTQQLDPMCRLLQTSSEASLEAGAAWLGLYSSSGSSNSSSCSSCSSEARDHGKVGEESLEQGRRHIQALQVAVGVSVRGQVWVYRAADYQDWKKVAAVLQATLSLAGAAARSPSRLVCVLPAADKVLTQALTSPHCGFTPPPPPAAATATATAMEDVVDIEAGCLDCIVFNEDIAQSLSLSLPRPPPPPPPGTSSHAAPTPAPAAEPMSVSVPVPVPVLVPVPVPVPVPLPNLLFLLAGQSNMSGRGRLSDLVADASLQDVRTVYQSRGLHKNTSPFVAKCVSASASSASAGQEGSGDQDPHHVQLSPPYARRVKAFDAKDFMWTEL